MNKKVAEKTILLVDDDAFLLDMYAVKFKEHGFTVKIALSGVDVLAKSNEDDKPDVILLDVVMPSIDGIELLRRIKKEKLAPNAVIIMLSNQGTPEIIAEADKLGADGFIIKASTIPSEVCDRVLALIEEKK